MMAIDIEDFEFAVADRFKHVLPLGSVFALRTPRDLAAAWGFGAVVFLGAGAVCAGILSSALMRLTRRWANRIYPSTLTVGALAEYVVAYGSPILDDLVTPATESQTLEVIQALARLEIGAPRVAPDATWESLTHLARAS